MNGIKKLTPSQQQYASLEQDLKKMALVIDKKIALQNAKINFKNKERELLKNNDMTPDEQWEALKSNEMNYEHSINLIKFGTIHDPSDEYD